MKKRALSIIAFISFSIILTACASSGPIPGAAPIAPGGTSNRTSYWAVKTREHVDLWLHGFALIQQDTTAVLPYFEPDYRDNITVVKNKANVLTQLDVNIERLQKRLEANPSLINAQFIPQYFPSGAVLKVTIDAFVAANGNPNAASSQQEAYTFAALLNYFPTPEDRAWLYLFASSLWDEHEKFYASYWIQQQQERKAVIDSVHSLWTNNIHPRLSRFLNTTQQSNGEILLSLPLAAEGRTLNTGSSIGMSVAVNFPETAAESIEAIYTVIHEVASSLAFSAVQDNTTPAQQRSGEADRMIGTASVRGGLIVLEHLAPEFATGYATYYLKAAGKNPGSDPKAELARSFPLSSEIIGNMSRQLETISGGI